MHNLYGHLQSTLQIKYKIIKCDNSIDILKEKYNM